MEGIGQMFGGEGYAFPNIDRCCFVIYSDCEQAHETLLHINESNRGEILLQMRQNGKHSKQLGLIFWAGTTTE